MDWLTLVTLWALLFVTYYVGFFAGRYCARYDTASLREWYAGQALRRMQGGSDAHVARNCFALADAMITESQTRKGTDDAKQRTDERGERGGE